MSVALAPAMHTLPAPVEVRIPTSSGAAHRVSASRLCGAVPVVYSAPAPGAEYISRRGRAASDDGVVHRNDAARFTGADDEVRGENGQRRFKKDFAQVPLSIEDPMEPDCTKRSVNSTSAFVNKMLALGALVILSPSVAGAVFQRLNRASWLSGVVVSCGTLSLFRCNTEGHRIALEREREKALFLWRKVHLTLSQRGV